MYTIDINTSKYDIKLLVSKFGKKTSKTIKKTMKKTDIVRMIKRLKKEFSHCDMGKLLIPV
ncbi:MAG: hypothetical protein WC799_09360 [Desulfobacteraceae bacterium]|jgi:hypothetical protein